MSQISVIIQYQPQPQKTQLYLSIQHLSLELYCIWLVEYVFTFDQSKQWLHMDSIGPRFVLVLVAYGATGWVLYKCCPVRAMEYGPVRRAFIQYQPQHKKELSGMPEWYFDDLYTFLCMSRAARFLQYCRCG